MSRRIDKIVELAARLAESRAEVAKLEAELEAMLGPGADPPVKHSPVGQAVPGRSSNGAGKAHSRKRSPLRDQVVALARDGNTSAEIAKKLGETGDRVAKTLWAARKAGELPKVRASS